MVFSAPLFSKENKQAAADSFDIVELSKDTKGCCGTSDAENVPNLSYQDYSTYRLTVTYFNLRENLTTTLMLNNKAPGPVFAVPTIYSLTGKRLSLPPISVPGASYIDVDMNELLAGAADEFREGSMKISYDGISQQLGAQVKMVDESNGMIWAEQFVYASKFVSSRLENVWWLPFPNSETKVVVSNTSGGTVIATLTVDGTSPQQSQPLQISLAPWETRVLDIVRDIAGRQNGHVHDEGGISITHSGAPGAVLARMFIARPNKGYSAAINFVDPANTASQRWHGNGLRLRNLDGQKVDPVIAVRNVGNQSSNVAGRIIYTRPDGEVAEIAIPSLMVGAGQTKSVELKSLITGANLPTQVTYGGIEIGYDTPPGSIVTSVQSLSANGEHVFQVPIFDPQKMPASAGGFPWKADSDYSTVVYLKNETTAPKKYSTNLLFGNGLLYSLGIKEIKGGQTVEIDFRKLRDRQIPDVNGNLIPLSLNSGQIAWSMRGPDNKTMSGRSEQISLRDGVASTYACYNCCADGFGEGWIDASEYDGPVGGTESFFAMQKDVNCMGTTTAIYPVTGGTTYSNDPSIADFVSGSTVEAFAPGSTTIEAFWETGYYTMAGVGYEECYWVPVYPQPTAPVDVVLVEINAPTQADDGSSVFFTSTVTGATPTGYQWSVTTPSGSGNSPSLNFTSATSLSTFATAKWFASPDDACSAPNESTYTVKLTVSFSGRSPITKEKSFKVNVPWNVAGETNGGPHVGGTSQKAQNAQGIWYVVGLGTLNVTTSAFIQMNIPTTSQFYSKMYAHEQHHVNQWAQPNGLYGSQFTNAGLWAAIQNLTDVTEQGLIGKINIAAANYLNSRQVVVNGLCNQAETAAYGVSDLLTPMYLYQTCGRTTFPGC